MACIIEKNKFATIPLPSPNDPYIFSFSIVLDRQLSINREDYTIYPEKRGNPEDLKLELTFLQTKISGTNSHKGAEVAERIRHFELVDKKRNMAGSQIADLIATPIGRYHMQKPKKRRGKRTE